jgi:hypothetical protein
MSNKKELLQQQYTLLLKGRKALDAQLDTYKTRFDAMCREIHKVENEIDVYEKNLLFIEARLRKETKTKPINIPKAIPFEKALPEPIPEEPEPEPEIMTKDIKDDDVGEDPCIFESLYVPSDVSETSTKTFFSVSEEPATETAKVIDFDNMSQFKPEIDKVGAVGWFVKVWTEQEFEGAIIKLQKKQLKLKTSEGIINIPYYMIQDWERIEF